MNPWQAEQNGRSSGTSASNAPAADPHIEFWRSFLQTPSTYQSPVFTFPEAPIVLRYSARSSRSLRASYVAVLFSTWTLQRDCIVRWNGVASERAACGLKRKGRYFRATSQGPRYACACRGDKASVTHFCCIGWFEPCSSSTTGQGSGTVSRAAKIG